LVEVISYSDPIITVKKIPVLLILAINQKFISVICNAFWEYFTPFYISPLKLVSKGSWNQETWFGKAKSTGVRKRSGSDLAMQRYD